MEDESATAAGGWLEDLESGVDEMSVVRTFIHTYEALPVLWNPTHPDYMNKTRRNTALDQLLFIYGQIKPGAKRADVRNKINSLRTNYRKEVKKVAASKRSDSGTGHAYQPTSWSYYALQFLDRINQPVNSNVHRVSEDSLFVEEASLNEENATSPETPPPPFVPAPPQSSLHPSPVSPVVKKPRTMGPVVQQSELFQNTCSYFETPTHDIPTIAKAWGEKIETLEPHQRVYAEKAINDILFEASLGNLDRYSVRINEDSPYQMNRVIQNRLYVSPPVSVNSIQGQKKHCD